MAIKKNKKNKRITTVVVVLLLLAAVIAASVIGSRGDLPEVKTARVERRSLIESKVTANGEVRPIQFINLTAEVSGRVTDIFVKEGDQVTKGQPLLRVDPTQQASATSLQEAGLRASQAEAQNQMAEGAVAENAINNARAALNAAQADLARARVERDFAKIELLRNADLIEQGIVSRSVYDAAKMRFDVSVVAVKSAQARAEQARTQVRDAELRVAQSRAALRAAQARAEQARASLRRESDLLSKTTQHSPIKGVIASLPIQIGMFALANFQSTPLMVIADMSSINVEARVDETGNGRQSRTEGQGQGGRAGRPRAGWRGCRDRGFGHDAHGPDHRANGRCRLAGSQRLQDGDSPHQLVGRTERQVAARNVSDRAYHHGSSQQRDRHSLASPGRTRATAGEARRGQNGEEERTG
jgi:multidrug resistance efflux pump